MTATVVGSCYVRVEFDPVRFTADVKTINEQLRIMEKFIRDREWGRVLPLAIDGHAYHRRRRRRRV